MTLFIPLFLAQGYGRGGGPGGFGFPFASCGVLGRPALEEESDDVSVGGGPGGARPTDGGGPGTDGPLELRLLVKVRDDGPLGSTLEYLPVDPMMGGGVMFPGFSGFTRGFIDNELDFRNVDDRSVSI